MAVPPDKVPVPRVVAPSLNVTVPVGVPPVLVTVAVKVTKPPYVDGLGLSPRIVDVGIRFTTWLTADNVVDVAKFASPP